MNKLIFFKERRYTKGMLDTLKANKSLLRVGFTEDQADVIVEIEQQKQNELASKDFIDKKINLSQNKLEEKISHVKTEVAELKTQMVILNKFMYLNLGFMFITILGGTILMIVKLFFLD